MSENWKNILVRFRKSVKKAEAHLCNSKGQNIVGVHQISFKTLILKFVKEFKAEDEKIVYLCCNLVNHMQKKLMVKIYCPSYHYIRRKKLLHILL